MACFPSSKVQTYFSNRFRQLMSQSPTHVGYVIKRKNTLLRHRLGYTCNLMFRCGISAQAQWKNIALEGQKRFAGSDKKLWLVSLTPDNPLPTTPLTHTKLSVWVWVKKAPEQPLFFLNIWKMWRKDECKQMVPSLCFLHVLKTVFLVVFDAQTQQMCS